MNQFIALLCEAHFVVLNIPALPLKSLLRGREGGQYVKVNN